MPEGIVLLGWLPRDVAVHFLQQRCQFDPPLNEQDAERYWEQYRAEVERLGTRDVSAPRGIPITDFAEDAGAKKFLRHARLNGIQSTEVIKVDPMRLVIRQFDINIDRATHYKARVASREGWVQHALLLQRPMPASYPVQYGPNVVDYEVPHAEWQLGFNPRTGPQIQQLATHISANAFDGRLMLFAGYHRSFARMLAVAPDAIDRTLVVALTTDGETLLAPNSPDPRLRDLLRSPNPPLFADFFNERLVMKVKLHKVKYHLQIVAHVAAIVDT